MSDSELSDDGIGELQELIAEYEAKAETKTETSENNTHRVLEKTPKNELESVAHAKKRAKNEYEISMDKVIFGDKNGLLKKLAKAVNEPTTNETTLVKVESDVESEDEAHSTTKDNNKKRKAKKRKPVWIDADDEQIQVGEVRRETKYTGPLDHLRKDKTYKEHLTARFTRIVAQPKWATLDAKPKRDSDLDSDDEELLGTVGFLAKTTEKSLQSHDINFKRLKDLNRATYAEGTVTSVQFHPTSTAALVAGKSGIATIYAIDGRQNEKLHSIAFRHFPIKCAKIKPCGTKAIFGSARAYYYVYDLLTAKEIRYTLPRSVKSLHKFQVSPCGRYMAVAGQYGALHLFEAASNELVHTFQQENSVGAICFTADSRRLICNSHATNVSVFSLREQRLEHSFIDDGCISGRALDLAPNQRLLATGSMEGVVNVYDFDKVLKTSTPLPEKSFFNLTTAISDVRFNHTSELLAMCSAEVHGAVKLAHFPSATVYANFPQFNSGFQKIHTVEFSPSSGYFALGNRAREVSLLRLKHFNNY